MKRISFTAFIAGVTLVGIAGSIEAAPRRANPDAKLHRYSTTIEKERPQLNDETKRLIAAYRRDPSEANYAALKKQVERNYDAVVARKKAKLEELKRTARDQYKVEEMQNIVDEMLRDRDQRVENSMRRFTDQRFRPGLRNRSADGYQQVLGAGQNVSIGYAPVTNEDYAKFIAATGRKAPRTWKNGRMPEDLAKHSDSGSSAKARRSATAAGREAETIPIIVEAAAERKAVATAVTDRKLDLLDSVP